MTKQTEYNFEERLARLSEIVELLESGTISLADSVTLYKEGLEHSTKCKEELEKAKHEVKILQNGTLENFTVDVDQSQDHINALKD